MRYSLRTLLIAMLLVGPLAAYAWNRYQVCKEQQLKETERNFFTQSGGGHREIPLGGGWQK